MKEQRNEARKSPIPASWNKAVKGLMQKGRRTPTLEGPDIFCDESTADKHQYQVKSVRPKSSTSSRSRKTLANVDTGSSTEISVSSAESRARRIERIRKGMEQENRKVKARDSLSNYSGSPQRASATKRSQSRSPPVTPPSPPAIAEQVTVIHEQRVHSPKKRKESRVSSRSPRNVDDAAVPIKSIRPDSRASQFADDEQEDNIVLQKEERKSVKWHSGVKSCSPGDTSSTDDDITEDGTVSQICSVFVIVLSFISQCLTTLFLRHYLRRQCSGSVTVVDAARPFLLDKTLLTNSWIADTFVMYV